jgi:hypothetical protein
VPALLRLVLEIGAKSRRQGIRRGAVAGLALVALFTAGRLAAHQRAVALLDSRQYRGQAPLAVAAFPMPSNPLLWAGVVETDNALVNVEVPVGLGLEFDPDRGAVHYKPEQSAVLANAVNSGAAADFLSYARFPCQCGAGDGCRVRLRHAFCQRSPRHHRDHRRTRSNRWSTHGWNLTPGKVAGRAGFPPGSGQTRAGSADTAPVPPSASCRSPGLCVRKNWVACSP